MALTTKNMVRIENRLAALEERILELESTSRLPKARKVAKDLKEASHIASVCLQKIIVVTEVHRFAHAYMTTDESFSIMNFMLSAIDPANDDYPDEFWLSTQQRNIDWWIRLACGQKQKQRSEQKQKQRSGQKQKQRRI